jgi:hypothetical protein
VTELTYLVFGNNISRYGSQMGAAADRATGR